MSQPLEPEVVEAAADLPAKRKRRPFARYKIRNLPPPVKNELDARLSSGNFGTFEGLSLWLERDHGQQISPTSIHAYYRNNFDPMLRAVKTAALQSAEIMKVTGTEDDVLSLALFRLVQTAIFDLLVQINQSRILVERMPAAKHHGQAVVQNRLPAANEEDQETEAGIAAVETKFPNKVELAAVTALGKTTAIVSKALIELERWREKLRDKVNRKIEATSARICDATREAGLSPEVEKTIRDALLEIKV